MNSDHENEKDKTGKDKTGKAKNDEARRLLDAELDRLDQLYRSEESIEPPDLLDQTILNKARRSVESKNSWLDFGWIHAVTTVALVVLTFSIFTTQRETGEFEPTVGKSIDHAPGETTGHLSGQAESGQVESDRAESDRVISDRVITNQDSKQQQMREPASAASVSAQAAKRQSHSNTVPESSERAANRLSEPDSVSASSSKASAADSTGLFQEEKHSEVMDQLDSLDTLETAPELELASEISQQQLLDRILTLKHAGDERWTEELAAFKQLYPDFPLPEELKNQEIQNNNLKNKKLQNKD